jgi:hypothetical protein
MISERIISDDDGTHWPKIEETALERSINDELNARKKIVYSEAPMMSEN